MFEQYLAALLGLRQARDLAFSALPDAPHQTDGKGGKATRDRRSPEPVSPTDAAEPAPVDRPVAAGPNGSSEWDPCPCRQWGLPAATATAAWLWSRSFSLKWTRSWTPGRPRTAGCTPSGRRGHAHDRAGVVPRGAGRWEVGLTVSFGLLLLGFASGSPLYLGTEEVRSRPYAEATQRVVDEEVAKLLREAEGRATAMLADHRDALDHLTELLLERETVDGTDVDEVLGRVPGQPQPIGATGHTTTAPGQGPATPTRR
jgi:Peptidase family M41